MTRDDTTNIIGVVNLYALAVDTQRWDWFDRVFTPDIEVDFGGPAVWRDLASLKTAFAAIHSPFASTQHLTTNHVVVIDGDHNYWTVSEELRLLSERAPGAELPLLLFHDVCWPHARRDDYFAPELIPEVRGLAACHRLYWREQAGRK